MYKHKLINGWTKETVKARIRERVPQEGCASDNTCLYRNAKGKSCAAGAFIPDALYKTSMERQPIQSVIRDNKLDVSLFPFNEHSMSRFQDIHDNTVSNGENVIDELVKFIDNDTEE